MKIGIVTLPLSRNYGGILQNYALQQTLKRLGHFPFTLELEKFTWGDWLYVNIKVLIKKCIGRNAKFIAIPRKKGIQPLPLRQFVDNKIVSIVENNRRHTSDKILKHNIDVLIVGSDQVWRPKYSRNISDMYLGFAEKLKVKRIAYAASFGTDKWEYSRKQTQRCKTLINKFNAISVREQSAVKLCEKYYGVTATHLLDPTLLLTADSYNILIENTPVNSNKILFAYILDITEDKIKTIHAYAKKMGLEPIIISAGDDIKVDDSIEKWLSYFRDSSFIITDSFHGMVFSIIYSKEFRLFLNLQRGADRFTSLLDLLKIQNVIIDTDCNILNTCVDHIDWNNVQFNLQKQRILSEAFINNALTNI